MMKELCVQEKSVMSRYLTSAVVAELFDNITERYFEINCAVFVPNSSRIDHVKDMFGR
jgi:benzoyl-CoA reductase/2-hydroxyglutaryl-CoA dehydratase subunit BcrC/BadD/HgdB